MERLPQSSVTPSSGELPLAGDQKPAESRNIALVRKAMDAFAERDIQRLLKLVHPSMELFAPGTAALTRDGRSYRGYAGIFTYFRDIGRMWLELQVVPHEFLDAPGAVVVFGRLRARAYGGYLIDEPAQWVVRILDGKIAWASACDSRESALELAAAE
jgi:ketosteroid isomerase-like protein